MTQTCPICQSTVPDGAPSCPTCGYNMQGSTQKFQPVSVGAPGAANSEIFNEALLKITAGHQVGSTFRLAQDSITVGRSPQCDIFLNDMTVSRNHAIIERHEGVFYITDQGSFNGVWINNRNISKARLYDGDTIQIGTFSLQFMAMDPTR